MRIPFVLLCFVLVNCLSPTFAQRATRNKAMLVRGFPLATDPISIKIMNGLTELKSEGGSDPNNYGWKTAFEADDDWITNLSFTIKNVSEKKITCITIISFLQKAPFWEDDNKPGRVLGFFQNRVGRRPEHALHSGDRTFPADTDASFQLAPGEQFAMLVEDPKDYPKLKANIEKQLPISDVTALDTGTVTIYFDDGSRWISVNHSYSRPAAQPGKWTRISFEEWAGRHNSAEQ